MENNERWKLNPYFIIRTNDLIFNTDFDLNCITLQGVKFNHKKLKHILELEIIINDRFLYRYYDVKRKQFIGVENKEDLALFIFNYPDKYTKYDYQIVESYLTKNY